MEYINSLIERKDATLKHNFLGRMQIDCEYYLGNGGRNPKHLWAGNEQEQIEAMRALHNSFPDDAKPQYLTTEQIDKYAEQMLPKA